MRYLPVDDILPELVQILEHEPMVILEAPPGAGKSTRVPPALLDAGFASSGQVWVLEPRRVAARAVATRIAYEREVILGQEVGYAVRFDRRAGVDTQLLVVTEGLLLARLLDDPFLEGIGCVVLDEFHERSVDADLCLAMLKEVIEIRDDLKVVVMSATLQSERLSAYLNAPVIVSKGRQFEVESHFLEKPDEDYIAQASFAVRRAIEEDDGDVLVFMPGKREIEQTIRAIQKHTQVQCVPLHGGLSLEAQMQAIAPSSQQRIIVTTNIAETSLTVEGVTSVVDSGKVKKLIASDMGLDQLVLSSISLASAKQRAGRAGRVRAGRVYRLWTRAQSQFFEAYDEPAMVRVDITQSILYVLAWSSQNPADFYWFEAPPVPAIDYASRLLRQMGALEKTGWTLTEHGRCLLKLPLHPRLGQMIIEGARLGVRSLCLEAAAVLSDADVRPYCKHQLNQSCELYEALSGARGRYPGHIKRSIAQLDKLTRKIGVRKMKTDANEMQRFQRALMRSYPDRICMQREVHGDRYLMNGQQPVLIARQSKVMRSPWVLAVSLHGQTRDRVSNQTGTTQRALVRLGTVIEESWLKEDFPTSWTDRVDVGFDVRLGRVVAQSQVLFDGVVVTSRVVSVQKYAAPEAVATILSEAASEDIERAFSPGKEDVQLLARLGFINHWMPHLGLPQLDRFAPDGGRSPETMMMLLHWCWGHRGFDDLKRESLAVRLRQSLTHTQWQALEQYAPAMYKIPSGSMIRLDYSDHLAPVLAARIQELFGLLETPTLAGGAVRLTMHLLAPNYRPAQVTQDLASFWTNTYLEVRKELRARYPKHPWPEDPMQAKAIRK